MNRDVYSNHEFTQIKNRLNEEIKRRGTFRWWDPLVTPTVGEDRSSPMSLPDIGERVPVNDQTYTINNPSEGSIEPTLNVRHPLHGEFPAGEEPKNFTAAPSTTAAQITADELRNALVGLSKIHDINLFYGRDEIPYLAFRDPQGIEDVLTMAEQDKLSRPLKDSDISVERDDPNGGASHDRHPMWPNPVPIQYPEENGIPVMPSGERDGEEVPPGGLSPDFFFDDYGAPQGVADYHPFNPGTSPTPNRDWDNQGRDRGKESTKVAVGGIPSSSYGKNPRNPASGESYPSRPVYGGVAGTCQAACTGLCYLTCDNQCSESCSTTCWSRCGEACTASCGNVCTGCTTLCYNTCKTKCENSVGYSCLKVGAKAVHITPTGGENGVPAKNELHAETYTCSGCAYTCQFYPNKKTTCWDAACMGKCFNTCMNSCSTSCYGGCVDNTREEGTSYKTGHGRGCSGGCTLNCIGFCSGVCEGVCVNTCWHGCKATCEDNCSWTCSTDCGTGCEVECTNGCDTTCSNHLSSRTNCENGCDATCEHKCTGNCVSIGCRSLCGTNGGNACTSNCRMTCSSASCTSLCSDACSSECTTCVNTCGWQCGACVSQCSAGCEASCNINCTQQCENSCDGTCVHSCTEECGGCSNLCYSCVGMCIGLCSMKCETGCTNCTNNCSWWCDTSCSRGCFANCSDRCISTCSGSCSTYLMSEAKTTIGPERDPTSEGYIYPHPKNRFEERESFKLFKKIAPYKKPIIKPLVTVEITKEDHNVNVICDIMESFVVYQTSINGGVYSTTEDGNIHINLEMLTPEIESNKPNVDNSDAIYIVVIRTPGTVITRDDIVYRVPIGFRGFFYAYDDEMNAVVVIERDIFLYPPEKNCWCNDYVELTEEQFLEIWNELRTKFPSEINGYLVGIDEEHVKEIWEGDGDYCGVPYGPTCDCGEMREMDVGDVWYGEEPACDCGLKPLNQLDVEEMWEGSYIERPSASDIEHDCKMEEIPGSDIRDMWTDRFIHYPTTPGTTFPGCGCDDLKEIDEDSVDETWKEGENDDGKDQ